jgi:acyl-CoA synthetase (AMP-forming)/AMP-acid ligase II
MRLTSFVVAVFAVFLAGTPAAPAETTPTATETTSTVTEPEPAPVLTGRQSQVTTVFGTTTVEQVTTVVETSISPAAAAKAGAAAAQESESSSDTTDWGWVAFGILAAAVIGGGTVWLVHRRRPARGG